MRVGIVEQSRGQNEFAYQMLPAYIQGYLGDVSKQTRWQYIYEKGTYQECTELLRKFAAVLKDVFRQGDCLGCFGDDEFVAFITGEMTRNAVEKKARRILTLIRKISKEDAELKVIASVGVAMYPEHGAD